MTIRAHQPPLPHPPHLEKLHLLFEFTVKTLPYTLIDNITYLSLGSWFDGEVDHLPPTITCLYFDYSFNQQVDNLPHSITHLTFGNSFNQPVDNLPPSITHLSVSSRSILSMDHLPPSLTHLIFRNQNCFSEDSIIYIPQSCKVSVYGKKNAKMI